jgi:hypothetical protein|tara:strand:+ start:635 stop:1015 length:381 start_codon:yes stop_codon:yes gene_type:complete
MGRPTKKEINLSKESMLSLMQEIYNEVVEQRNTAIRIQNKMLTMMKEPEDMTVIGPVIEKQQKIVNDCIEKKLTLSKLQSSMWEKSNANKDSGGSFSITDIGDDELLRTLMEKDISKDNDSYKMKK